MPPQQQRSEDSFGDLVPSYHVGSRDGTRVIRLGSKHPQQLMAPLQDFPLTGSAVLSSYHGQRVPFCTVPKRQSEPSSHSC